MESKVLNNGLKMPMVGLGVYNINERETQRVVEDAISVGYRCIDTAAMYYNEKGVGDAVRACGVPREEHYDIDLKNANELGKRLVEKCREGERIVR